MYTFLEKNEGVDIRKYSVFWLMSIQIKQIQQA